MYGNCNALGIRSSIIMMILMKIINHLATTLITQTIKYIKYWCQIVISVYVRQIKLCKNTYNNITYLAPTINKLKKGSACLEQPNTKL